MKDDFATFFAIIGVSIMASGVGALIGVTIEERHWQRVLVEQYDATYCDGEFSLEECN